MLQKTLFATATIGGAKIISDQIKNLAGILREVGTETSKAVSQLEKMGNIRGIADATKQADMLSSSLENVKNKIGEINSSNLLTKGLAQVTGTRAELEAHVKTLQRLKDGIILFGFESEVATKKALIGASDYDKAFIEINKKLEQNKTLIGEIADEETRKAALIRAEDLASLELMDVIEAKRKEIAEKSEEYRQKIRDAEHKAQIELRDSILEAKRLGDEFDKADEERKQRYIERAKQRINAIDTEIESLKERNKELRAATAEDVLLTNLRGGAGQGVTSEEIRFLKKADEEVQKERSKTSKKQLDEEVKRLRSIAEEKKKTEGAFYEGPDPKAIGLREARKSLGQTAIEERKAKDPIISSSREIDKNNTSIVKNTKERQRETDSLGKSTEGFIKIGQATNLVDKALGGVGTISEKFSDSLEFSTKSSDDLKTSFDFLGERSENTAGGVYSLGSSAMDAADALGAIDGIQDVTMITTQSIILEA